MTMSEIVEMLMMKLIMPALILWNVCSNFDSVQNTPTEVLRRTIRNIPI